MTSRLMALALAALIGLATSGEAQQQKVRKDRNLITVEELSELHGQTGYEAVQKLRPDWLRRAERRVTLDMRADRGSAERASRAENQGGDEGSMLTDVTASPLKLTVFVDHTEMGGVEELERLRNDEIREIRYLNGSDAQQRYGARFAAGVIQVTLKSS